MIEITANTVLLDIEGTISPYSYLLDVLLPYAVNNARSYLERCWDDADTLAVCDLMARGAGFQSSFDWLVVVESRREDMIDIVMAEVERLAAARVQSPGLKALQGSIWAEAYATGRLRSQVFDDVAQALACWKATKLLVAIYSFTNSTAQREFVGHTEYGSLTDYFAGFFDTTSTGTKESPASFRRIAGLLNRSEGDIVYMSDQESELDVARAAGMQTLRLLRPDNPVRGNSTHGSAPSLYDVRILPCT